MIDITIIPRKVRELAEKAANTTKHIEDYLKTGIALDIAALFPGGTALDATLIATCETAIKACKAVEDIADSPAVAAILQRLGADLTMMQHDGDHSISHYITWFETVFADLFKK